MAWDEITDDCTWPTCLPDDEQDRLCASILAVARDEPDPYPYAGDPHLCPTNCTPKQHMEQHTPANPHPDCPQ